MITKKKYSVLQKVLNQEEKGKNKSLHIIIKYTPYQYRQSTPIDYDDLQILQHHVQMFRRQTIPMISFRRYFTHHPYDR